MRPVAGGVALAVALLLAGCQSDVERQTAALTLSDGDVAQRAVRMRRFDTADRAAILSAAAGVLQDLGYSVDDVSSTNGLLNASKTRDASGGSAFSVDRVQRIRASIVASPGADGRDTVVRASFQRVVRGADGRVTALLPVTEATIYQRFFDELSQSAFLQGHGL